jgi:hypothetical protein
VSEVETDSRATTSCPTDRRLSVTVTRAKRGNDNAIAAVVDSSDSSSWRLGDVVPLTTTLAREGGAFTVCLDADPAATTLYSLGFIGAGVGSDGDGRLHAAVESLCDRTTEGVLGEELYFQNGSWRVGLRGTPQESLNPALAVDGDRCSP